MQTKTQTQIQTHKEKMNETRINRPPSTIEFEMMFLLWKLLELFTRPQSKERGNSFSINFQSRLHLLGNMHHQLWLNAFHKLVCFVSLRSESLWQKTP